MYFINKENVKLFYINNTLQNTISIHNLFLKKYKILVKADSSSKGNFTSYETTLIQIS